MTKLIDAAFDLLDVIMEETKSLPPEEAAAARARLLAGMTARADRVARDEAGDLAAIPSEPS